MVGLECSSLLRITDLRSAVESELSLVHPLDVVFEALGNAIMFSDLLDKMVFGGVKLRRALAQGKLIPMLQRERDGFSKLNSVKLAHPLNSSHVCKVESCGTGAFWLPTCVKPGE